MRPATAWGKDSSSSVMANKRAACFAILVHVEFTGRISLSRLRTLYRTARALVFPGKEDFGIVPVEALACGTPVIAFGVGGAAETVRDGKTGVLFDEQSPAALAEAIRLFESTQIASTDCRLQAENFSKQRFQNELRTYFSDSSPATPRKAPRKASRETRSETPLELR
ncbi:MAG: glycosyltransferase [Bdellovibrionota bacterium]